MTTHTNANLIRAGLTALAVFALIGSAGCAAQSEMTDKWHDPTLAPNSVHNVLVIGIRKAPVRRRAWEDAFVAALTARGVTATASYRQFADAPPDTDDVIAAVRDKGYDAVLTSVRLPNEATSHYVPGTIRTEQYPSRDYYGRFHTRWIGIREEGYTETDTIVSVQTDVWVTGGGEGRLVWSATLRTLESTDPHNVEQAVDRSIMPEMESEGLVPHKTK